MFDTIALFARIDRIANDACIFVAERHGTNLRQSVLLNVIAIPSPRDVFDNIQALIYSVKIHYILGYNSRVTHYACAESGSSQSDTW